MQFSKNLIGHDVAFNNLADLYKKNNLPNKILLTGASGIGKSLFVNYFLNFVYGSNDHKNENDKLIKSNTHPNIFKIFKKKDKKNIDISQIREMIQFQNHSSFNDNSRFIVIEKIEFLSLNSANALLKSIEEPNKDVFFILINDTGARILDTIRSRCIEFKLKLNNNEVKEIVNINFEEDLYEKISNDFINNYNSPSFIISLINFCRDNNIDIHNISIENFIRQIIKDKFYSDNEFIKNYLNFFIELYFYKNIIKTKKIPYKIKNYFYFKLSEIKKYNLDLETFFLEFNEKILSE